MTASWICIIGAGLLAYANSLNGPFLFDDQLRIVEHARIHHLWPVGSLLAGSLRPVVDVSLAVNYAFGGVAVRGYHLLNLAIHLAAALLLFGLARRTLCLARVPASARDAADGLALALALLWTVHPLQTESVTYVIQRAESLMGLWMLLTLYALLRAATTAASRRWSAVAVLASALGMATKPVAATIPLVALLYDRTFLAGSFRAALRQRRGLYLGLAATWLILGVVLASPDVARLSAGFHLRSVTPLAYAQSQPGVILHYLRLVLWPRPLCLDYGWPVTHGAGVVLPTLLLGLMLLAVVWMLRRTPAAGFLGAAFFLLLAPTSSVIPIRDLAAEHRMYLPLAAVLALLVLGGWRLLQRLSPARGLLRTVLGAGSVAVLALVCVTLTRSRNAVYASEETMWRNVLAQRPANPRAHTNLGAVLATQSRLDEAMAHDEEALRLDPTYAEAHSNLAAALAQRGRLTEAAAHYREALRLWPDYAEAHVGLGVVLASTGHRDEAMRHLEAALRLNPQSAEAHNNFGVALMEEGRLSEAITHLLDALRLRPDYAKARRNLEDARARAR